MERPPAATLPGWTVLSLRPHGGHAGLRAASRRAGARFLALSPLRIALLEDADARQALAACLRCPIIVVTSANAVRAATRLARLPMRRRWIAVGAGTAAALRRAGLGQVQWPQRADSEGLLAMPALREVAGIEIGLLTGRGGRGLLAPALAARGARVRRADAYLRQPMAIPGTAWQRLRLAVADGQLLLPLTSGEAWAAFQPQLPPDLRQPLLGARVVAPGPRLAALARQAGFADVRIAAGPRPAQLLSAGATMPSPSKGAA